MDEVKTVSDAMQTTQIALDDYEDLFSDFDPSPYGKRILSTDFLQELHRRYSEDKKGTFCVNFTLPKSIRSEKIESLVKKRFKEYFRKELKTLEKTKKEQTKNGLIRIFAGAILAIFLVIIPELDSEPFLTIFSVLIWYTLWSGFEKLFESSKLLTNEIIFTEKFLKADYKFVSEEEVVEVIQKIQETPKEQKPPESS
ncbi:MAG: hypothetical protein ABH842_05140 [Candidatus Micrarchaeota archaeon]